MGRSECSMRELIKIETYWNVNHSISKQYPIK